MRVNRFRLAAIPMILTLTCIGLPVAAAPITTILYEETECKFKWKFDWFYSVLDQAKYHPVDPNTGQTDVLWDVWFQPIDGVSRQTTSVVYAQHQTEDCHPDEDVGNGAPFTKGFVIPGPTDGLYHPIFDGKQVNHPATGKPHHDIYSLFYTEPTDPVALGTTYSYDFRGNHAPEGPSILMVLGGLGIIPLLRLRNRRAPGSR